MNLSPRGDAMNLERMSLSDLRELAGSIDAIANACDGLAAVSAEAVVIDLTSGPCIGMPLFPRTSVQIDPTPIVVVEQAPVVAVTPVADAEPQPVAAPVPAKVEVPKAKAAPLIIGRWTPEEDKRLLDIVRANPHSSILELGILGATSTRSAKAVEMRLTKKLRPELKAIRMAVPDAPPRLVIAGPTDMVPVPAPAPIAGNAAARELAAHLNAVGNADPWEVYRDLALVEALARGTKLEVLAEDLEIPFAEVKARFFLLTRPMRDDRGHLGTNSLGDLRQAIKARIAAVAA